MEFIRHLSGYIVYANSGNYAKKYLESSTCVRFREPFSGGSGSTTPCSMYLAANSYNQSVPEFIFRNSSRFGQIIREEFLKMYSGTDWLYEFAVKYMEQGVVLPDPPEKGSLNLAQGLDSKYFFA